MQKFVSQRQRTAQPMPMPRMRSGKSSESSSQVTGERKPCWKNRKVTVSERTTNGRISVPASRFERTPIAQRQAIVPIWPVMMSGRRP